LTRFLGAVKRITEISMGTAETTASTCLLFALHGISFEKIIFEIRVDVKFIITNFLK